MPVDWNLVPNVRYNWDGSVAAFGGDMDESAHFHEIAHFQLASIARKNLPEFGLGTGPDAGMSSKRESFIEDAVAEESRASLLGIALEAEFSFNFTESLKEHGWYEKYKSRCRSFQGIV